MSNNRACLSAAICELRNSTCIRNRWIHPDVFYLLLSSADSITEFFDEYPNINRQLIRQAITNAQKEKKEEKPPKYSRQLFKIIKDIIV